MLPIDIRGNNYGLGSASNVGWKCRSHEPMDLIAFCPSTSMPKSSRLSSSTFNWTCALLEHPRQVQLACYTHSFPATTATNLCPNVCGDHDHNEGEHRGWVHL